MLVKLTEVFQLGGNYGLREVAVNPEHVVAVREDSRGAEALREGRFPPGLNPSVGVSRVYLNSTDVLVLGSQDIIIEKLGNGKRLLKG